MLKMVYTLMAILSAVSVSTPAVHAQTSTKAQPASTTSIFTVVPMPSNPYGFDGLRNDLDSVSGSSASDIWAVGQRVIHYDGSAWTAFPAPQIDGEAGASAGNQLTGVADISPDNVWAVGNLNVDADNPNQLIEHYDGTSWSVSPGPSFSAGETQPSLASVTALSASDVWAAGTVTVDDLAFFPLLEHFDGTSWTATAVGLSDTGMFSVSADATNDVWAVGTGGSALHFNGKAWNLLTIPIPGNGENALFSVTALAPNNVWAVGFYVEESNEARPRIPLIEHWNGISWQIIPSPNPGGSNNSNELFGVTAVSAKDIYAYGYSFVISSGDSNTLVMHWDGTSWTVVSSPDPKYKSILNDGLSAGTVLPTGDLWLVGGESIFRSLVLHATVQ